MFDWLSQFLNGITSIFPRLVKVCCTERMVLFQPSGRIEERSPGLHVCWPVIQEYQVIDIRWKSALSYVQTLTLADGNQLTLRTLTVWRPEDVICMIQSSEDYEDRVSEMALSVVVDCLAGATVADLQDTQQINAELTEEISDRLLRVGVEVDSCKLTECVRCRSVRLINDNWAASG